jgi:DNA-binding Lrp family transcriptional regulator
MSEDDLGNTLSKLKNPRMSAGRVILYSLLDELQGDSVSPGRVREYADSRMKGRDVSKQSITNAARRLEEAGIITRTEGYSVNYGYLISVLLHTVMKLTDSVNDLREELDKLKESMN